MNKFILATILAAILSIVVAVPTSHAFADTKSFNCDTSKTCKAVFKKVNGDVEITFGGGGGGTVTVDQQARDGVTQLRSEDVNQNTKLDALTTENQALKQNVTDLTAQLSSATSDIATLKAQVANLSNANPVVDINVTNGTAPAPVPPVDNGTGNNGTIPEPTPIPPVNGTGTNSTNSTG